MGLLDKALHGVAAPKAPALPEVEDLEFEFDSLERELLGLPITPDYCLAAFARLAEALPFEGLALFLPMGGSLSLAACLDRDASGPAPSLPAELARSLPPQGAELEADALSALGAAIGQAVTGAWGLPRRSPADASYLSLWTFSFPSAPARVARLLAAVDACPAPPLCLPDPADDAAQALWRAVPMDRCAVAMCFDLASAYRSARSSVPGLCSEAFMSAATCAACRLLSSNGKALALGDGRLALVLSSSSPLDPELVLFQFRKSFSRSLALFEGAEPPKGESFAFDHSEGGAFESLARFLSVR